MRALDILFFLRPMLLLPVWTVYLLFYGFYFPDQSLSLSFVADLASFSLIMAAAYVINQIFDIETDRLNRKLGFFEPPISLTLTQGWLIYALLNVAALMYAVFARPVLFAPFSVTLVVGVLYSAPPIRAKDRPIPGLLFNGFTYSLLIWSCLAAVRNLEFESLGEWSVVALESALVGSVFLAISAVYLMTTLPDAEGDQKTGKRTIGVACGARVTSILAAIMVAGALGLSYLIDFWPLMMTAAICLPLFVTAAVRGGARLTLLSAKAPILILTFLAAYENIDYAFFCIALILLTRFYFKRRLGISYPQLV